MNRKNIGEESTFSGVQAGTQAEFVPNKPIVQIYGGLWGRALSWNGLDTISRSLMKI
jgi:hypothetical protein